MSHGRHSISGEITHLIADVKRMSQHDAEQFYGIELNSDKTIYDYTYDKTFKNINEWATYVVTNESDDWEEDEYDHYNSKWTDEA